MIDSLVGTFFAPLLTGTGDVQVVNPVMSTTTTGRTHTVYCPALSSIAIHISGTASVQIISNPFEDTTRDLVLQTVTTTSNYTVASAGFICLNIASISGTVSAVVVYNTEID